MPSLAGLQFDGLPRATATHTKITPEKKLGIHPSYGVSLPLIFTLATRRHWSFMENSYPPTQCDCFQDKTADLPGDRSVQVAYIDKRVNQIDHHIQQLIELRNTLTHRSNQLQTPFYSIPSEIISYIFQNVVQTDYDSDWDDARLHDDLRQAFVLCSVSRCFREIALGTSELWQRLDFEFSSASSAINKFVPLFRHCVSHISRPDFNICLHFDYSSYSWLEEVPLITETLFSPVTAHKIKHLTLHLPPRWILSASLLTFSALDTLAIVSLHTVDLNLGNYPLLRVSLAVPYLKSLTLAPPVQVLNLENVYSPIVISILHQRCPNVVKCPISGGCSTARHPLTFHHLKELTWSTDAGFETIRNLRLPSLEHLRLWPREESVYIDTTIISICEQVSPTLISLDFLSITSFADDGLRHLCSLEFPHLEKLSLNFEKSSLLLKVIEALLSQAESENNASKIRYMPNLRFLSLSADSSVRDPSNFIPSFLDLLKQKRFGEVSDFHLDLNIKHRHGEGKLWPLELREELKSIIRGRKLKLTRDEKRIEWLE